MARMLRSCIQSILKLVNSVLAMFGMALILYAVWMISIWQKQMGELPFWGSDHPAPWFIDTFLGLGITLCVITCTGHIAAETANGCCLYMYMLFVFLVLMLEAGVTADVFLNRNWEEDFPDDPTGNLAQFKDFIRSNFGICKWIGLTIVYQSRDSHYYRQFLSKLLVHIDIVTMMMIMLLRELCSSGMLFSHLLMLLVTLFMDQKMVPGV